jgi:hypothetical protein
MRNDTAAVSAHVSVPPHAVPEHACPRNPTDFFVILCFMDVLARALIAVGAIILLAGVILYLFGDRLGFLGLGRLPGDIRIERENFRFYFPIVTCIVISLILSLLVYVLARFR